MSIYSTDYKHYKYTADNVSVNHPGFDRDLDSSFSSNESKRVPSRAKSTTAIKNNCAESSQPKSFISEPVIKKSRLPLTQEALAMHNSFISTHVPFDFELKQNQLFEQSLINRVNEQCMTIKQEFNDKISKLEEQFAKAEKEYNQTRSDIEELNNIEKEYLNQGVQTDLTHQDIVNAKELQEFVSQTKKIVWDTPFIPIESICRQLPTKHDENICEHHRNKIERLELIAAEEKELYSNDNNATLKRITNWSKTIYHH